MEHKVKHTGWILCLISLAVFWLISLVIWVAAILAPREFLGQAILSAVIFGALAILLLFIFLGIPRFYIFTANGIALCFLFGCYKHYAWDAVTTVYRCHGYHSLLFVIEGEASGKIPCYLRRCNSVAITPQTEKLMRKCWKHPIEYKKR